MSEDGKFWISCWSLAAVVCCLLIASVTLSTMWTDSRVAAMVEGGADPIKAACALKGISGSAAAIICAKAAE